MAEKRFITMMNKYPKAIQLYCERLRWDSNKFKISISDEGISHPDLYLEDPNIGIIGKITQFLEPTNQNSVFIIFDDVGMGKSSIRDFVSKSLDELGDYYTVLITDPRLTSLQILKEIAKQIGAEFSVWDDRGRVKEALRNKLEDIATKGINLVIWVDEAEKIDREIISELRALSDMKTQDGRKMCKLILSGTPTLIKKMERFIKADPEDAAAFDDRASLNTFRLNRWTSIDIYNYWKLLSNFCGKTNPFTADAAETVFEISEGKPRTIAQITRLAFDVKALENYEFDSDLEITSRHVLTALKDYLGEQKDAKET